MTFHASLPAVIENAVADFLSWLDTSRLECTSHRLHTVGEAAWPRLYERRFGKARPISHPLVTVWKVRYRYEHALRIVPGERAMGAVLGQLKRESAIRDCSGTTRLAAFVRDSLQELSVPLWPVGGDLTPWWVSVQIRFLESDSLHGADESEVFPTEAGEHMAVLHHMEVGSCDTGSSDYLQGEFAQFVADFEFLAHIAVASPELGVLEIGRFPRLVGLRAGSLLRELISGVGGDYAELRVTMAGIPHFQGAALSLVNVPGIAFDLRFATLEHHELRKLVVGKVDASWLAGYLDESIVHIMVGVVGSYSELCETVVRGTQANPRYADWGSFFA